MPNGQVATHSFIPLLKFLAAESAAPVEQSNELTQYPPSVKSPNLQLKKNIINHQNNKSYPNT